MKYDLNAALLNLDGTPIQSPNGKPVTFKSIAVACLVQAQERASEDKYAAFKLALAIENAADTLEISAEDVARLKRIIGDTMPVVIVGRMFDLLEQKP